MTSQRPLGWPGTMRAARVCFNLLLAAFLFHQLWSNRATAGQATNAPAAANGKKKEKKPKPIKAIRIHVESRHDLPERSLPASVGHENPLQITVEKLPILNEVHVEHAALLDQPGGFQVQLKFNSMGARILESYTAAAAGRHLAIMTDVDGEARWLALPLIRQRIGTGVLAFSPDTTRDVAQRLVQGLNAEAERTRRQWLK